MTPPDEQDPPEWDPDLEREILELFEALEECEEDLGDLEKDVLILQKDIEEFLGYVRDHPDLNGNHLVPIFQRLAWQEARLRETLAHCLQNDEARRRSAENLKDNRLKARLLAICDRRLAVIRSALAACESGQQSLLALSDDLLLLDSHGVLLSPFWSDQVH